MQEANLLEALIITLGVIISQVAISWKSNNLILYRITQLESKQDKHNRLMERMAVAEQAITTSHCRIDSLERRLEE
jgi:hypothetical protein